MFSFSRLMILVLAALTGVVLLFVYYGEGSAFDKVSAAVFSAKETLPDFSKDHLKANVGIPERDQKSILELNRTINEIKTSNEKNCFSNYGGFQEFGDKGTSISLDYDSVNDQTVFNVMGGDGGKQFITDLQIVIKGVQPCIIAGDDLLVNNFFEKFFDEIDNSGTYFRPVSSIKISYDEGEGTGASCSNGNRIQVPELGKRGPNKYCDNFEDQGWIFSPDKRYICFFPTNTATNSDQHGIDNNYIWSLSSRVGNSLKKC